jgi:signal transduction histidine kinase
MEEKILFYSEKGQLIYDPEHTSKHIPGDDSDLKLATQGDVAYTINHMEKKVLVNFSYPVKVGDKSIGILRYTKDYTEIYDSSNKLLNIIIGFAVISFGAVFVFLYILSSSITIPIIQLSRLSNEVAEGNFDIGIDIKSNDEIGELAKNFSKMAEKIKSQIGTIENDRDKLRELEQHRKVFFDNVTHELKTPLTTISGYAQIIEENGFNDEGFFRRGIEHIQQESNRLHRMVLNLLELSKLNSGNLVQEFQKTDISRILKAACEELSIKALRYGMKINYEIVPELMVFGDKDKLKQAVINIIDNSIKYGSVESVICIKAFEKEKNVHVVVKDKGIGVPKDKVEHIFEPFYRVDKNEAREKGSNGLGLAITKTILEGHCGTIEMDSIENVGTTVVIKIPIYGQIKEDKI